MNLHTSPLSSLDNKYTFLFLSTNPFFISIAWSHDFFVSILSLFFFPKTCIYQWNHSSTKFFASFSDFATSSSSFKIFYFFTTFFTSIILSFFVFSSYFFLSPSFIPSVPVSFLLPLFSLLSSISTILVSLAFVSTAYHTFLDILSSLPFLLSSQSQDCGE